MSGPVLHGLVLRGGEVFDPESGALVPGDLRIADGVIAPGPAQQGDRVVDVAGAVVAPGLVDLHTHVFSGQDLGVDPDEVAPPAGVTTLIDAGSAGGHLLGAFRRSAVERSATRIRAFLNISSIGTTSILLGGELRAPYYADEEVAVAAAEANRDLVIGVKVRASADVAGANGAEALRRARRVADRVGLPLMVHLGPAPASIDDIADALGAGDIITHALSGWAGNGVIVEGRLRDSIRAARDRGVLLDVGHGMSGFDPETARTMIGLGEPPDTISTDLHSYSRPHVVDLPTVLSKFLALGMSLPEVLRRATLAPARAAGLGGTGCGTLRAGAPADVAVLRRVPGEVDLGGIAAHERLECLLTVAGGRIVHEAGRAV